MFWKYCFILGVDIILNIMKFFFGERNFKFIEFERNIVIGFYMFIVYFLYLMLLNVVKNGWICIFIYDIFVIMCNKCNKINR